MASGDFERDALRLKMLAGVIARLSRQDLEKKLCAEKCRINPLGLGVLRVISRNDCTISELSQKMFLASATLVPVIDSLEKEGLITRNFDPEDRRRNPLSLTPKSEALVARMSSVHKNDLIVKGLSKIGKKKTSQIIKILSELVDNVSGNPNLSEKILKAVNNGKTGKLCACGKAKKRGKNHECD